ncbi:mitochondrial glycoprotein [Globomyces pollinis-pini]|nr:mitochondrial glycoprotein [Globomyces pollinis-pini]KAJ2993211.1 Mitochondrial acidic protein mam33 [Globomyces sp. JEL0801]
MSLRIFTPRLFRFTTFSLRNYSTPGNKDLLAKLSNEINHELENPIENPDWLQLFKSQNNWSIVDKPLHKEIQLKRTFNNESISVLFSTDSLADNFENEFDEQDEPEQSPIAVSIIVQKENAALEITANAQDSTFFIDNVAFLKDPALALDDSANGDWTRRGYFTGPVFAELDEALIEVFHKYIEERGLNADLADFISNYVVYKEQAEYVLWLKNVSDFVKF